MLIAYDADGNVVATLDYLVHLGPDGEPDGLVDFAECERQGIKMREVWNVSSAVGSGVWPEYLGSNAHSFRIERDAKGRITALVHKKSGLRRERAAVEAAIADRIAQADGQPADIRDLVGGPDRPLFVDDEGNASRRQPRRPNRQPPLMRYVGER